MRPIQVVCLARRGIGCLVLFGSLLVALALVRGSGDDHAVAFIDAYYRAGALVFGGGHVVLPLLHATVVDPGWVSDDRFLAGYGAAQAVPGPLFTFAAYLGTVSAGAPSGIPGAALALVAIFLPSFLLVFGALPFWSLLRQSEGDEAGTRRRECGGRRAAPGRPRHAGLDARRSSRPRTSSSPQPRSQLSFPAASRSSL